MNLEQQLNILQVKVFLTSKSIEMFIKKICNEAELINPAIGFIKTHTNAIKNSFPANLKLSLAIQSNGTDLCK